MAHTHPTPDSNASADLAIAVARGYEPHDIGLRGVFYFIIVLVITVIAVLILMDGAMNLFVEHDRAGDPVGSPVVIERGPVPHPLQPSMPHNLLDREDMAAMRAHVQSILTSSGQVGDRRFIPISQAMDQALPMLPIQPAPGTGQGGSP